MPSYFIIGGDGKQYGPISADDLRKWIAEGRVNAQTKARVEGATEWQSLSSLPELGDAFRGFSPPPLPAGVAPAKTSGLAVTSLVLGILGLPTCGLAALFGLILGVIALVKAKAGRGVALAGVIVSAFSLLVMPLLLAMFLPALAAAKQKAQTISCVVNEKQLAEAVRTYSGNNKGQFPPAATWCDAIKADVGLEGVFKCVAANSSNRCDYAFNAKLGGMSADKIAPNTVMIFESDGGWNANGGPEQMISKPRHAGRFVVAFADGSVQQLRASQLNTLRWDP
jgi:prepilin-type processing-associated H-X9-DG protein